MMEKARFWREEGASFGVEFFKEYDALGWDFPPLIGHIQFATTQAFFALLSHGIWTTGRP